MPYEIPKLYINDIAQYNDIEDRESKSGSE